MRVNRLNLCDCCKKSLSRVQYSLRRNEGQANMMWHTWQSPLLRLNTFRAVWFRNMMTSLNGNIFRVTGSLCKEGQWRRVMFSFIYPWINRWVNNRYAGDLRRHCTYYDVTVMKHEYAFEFPVHSQIHSCWWHGDATNQNIIRRPIEIICPALFYSYSCILVDYV